MSENETFEVEAEPASAAAIFGEGLSKARRYAELLVRDGELLGLVGPRELPKLWTRHILNSAVVAELVADGEDVADVGSGAGLPGIPMAIARPGAKFTLIEPMERRSEWLKIVVAELGLNNVTILRARAEEVGLAFDAVTARAVAALPQLLRLCVPLTRNGGRVIALKGSKAQDEIEKAKPLMKKLKVSGFEIVHCGSQFLAEPTLVVRTEVS